MIWFFWVMATIFFAAAIFFYLRWGKFDVAMPMLGGTILFGLIAYVRQKALERKKLKLRKAVDAYEMMLANAARRFS